MKTVTLSSLRTQVRQRADMENSTFVTDSELNSYINSSYAELYDILVQTFGPDYNLSSTTFSSVSGTASYSIASDFYKLMGVDALISGTDYQTLRPYMFVERNAQNDQRFLRAGLLDYRYRLQGQNLVLSPIPREVRTFKVWYTPVYTTMSADADTMDGVDGWEEYVIVDAAIKCLQKEESDVRVLLAQKEALRERITMAAENRDASAPLRMVDVRGYGSWVNEDQWL